ncbi:MAG: histidinol-phosphatase HisJ family protein [Clostridia bacterium]|nr:histidinol-phosphatase HisJ family protein [Clostridia bacterium]
MLINSAAFASPDERSGGIRADFHTHTVFSDGKNTPEEMVLAAIEKGMACIGFSDHSYTGFDESYCMKKEAIPAYRAEIARLGEKYADKITVLCGIEQDYYSDEPVDGYDYVIGSVHYVKAGDVYIPVDHTPAALKAGIDDYFGGDANAFAAEYFRTVGDVVRKTRADIIGHFDLLTKFIEREPLFDTSDAAYRAAWMAAADSLASTGKQLFEINTGAISRGYRTSPYPSEEQRMYIALHGCRFIMSSDSHRTDTLLFGF